MKPIMATTLVKAKLQALVGKVRGNSASQRKQK